MGEKPKEAFGADILLKELGGCGVFQAVLILLTTLAHIPDIFSHSLMSFGIYNPGWKCLDNDTLTTGNSSLASNKTETTDEWEKYNCDLYDSCQNVMFNPDASTILTEWGLLCNRKFILSTSLSMGSFGALGANLLVGYIGDRFGRKNPLMVTRFILAALNIAIIFSPSWQVHAGVLCLMGFFDSFGTLMSVIQAEYIPSDWRIKVFAIPTWSLFIAMFAVTAMYTHDWKILRWIAGISGMIMLVPMLWIPKSLRWLSVNGRDEEAYSVAKKVAKYNKAPKPNKDRIEAVMQKNDGADKDKKITTNTTVFHLFKKGYRLTSIALGCMFFSLTLEYFVMSFGIATLPGNIYINMLIMNAITLPTNLVTLLLGNRFSRKKTVSVLLCLNSLCYFGVVAVNLSLSGETERWTILGFVLVARLLLSNAFVYIVTIKNEVYPTVARSTASSYTSFLTSLGGIVSPYLIPTDPSTFWISYLVVGIIVFICALLVFVVPETRNKPLKDSWDDVLEEEKTPRFSFKRKQSGSTNSKEGKTMEENRNAPV